MPKRLTATKKKKRLEQLREAQRRRRTRLKETSQRFVQIILPEAVLERLRRLASESETTIQALIARIVERSVGIGDDELDPPEDVADAPDEKGHTAPSELVDERHEEAEAENRGEELEGDSEPPVEDIQEATSPEDSLEEDGMAFEDSQSVMAEAVVTLEEDDADEFSEQVESEDGERKETPLAGTAQLDLF